MSLGYQQEYKRHNYERLKYQEASRREEWRLKLLEIVGQSHCKDCGNVDVRVLQFDHVAAKVANVSSFLNKNWNKALAEAQKCEVVCANCHVLRTRKRQPKYEETPAKWVRRSKTHCPHGHPKTEENIYRYKNKKYCKPCKAVYAKSRRAK